MSGFIGILNLDGQPVDPRLLQDLTDFLAFRGPDAREIWSQDSVGFGHALLQATEAAAPEKQPGHLDARLSIVADARIDARADLIGKLRGQTVLAQTLSLATPDSELILHAYDAWAESCVEHLLGDFSFAIWDHRNRRLFCARDHMGVKPFFYARLDSCFIFSNTLDCIRKHPAVSNHLNELAIADFLLFDGNQDLGTTVFADVQRLPPAHVLSCQQGRVSVRRYWTLPVAAPMRISRDEEVVERFRELMDCAVADRSRSKSVGVLMSGGLDSSTVAASATRICSANGTQPEVHACTQVLDGLIPDEEQRYAQLVADALKIRIQFFSGGNCSLFEGADRPEAVLVEPASLAWPNMTPDLLRLATGTSRIALTGDGGDPGFSSRISVHFRQLLKKRELGRAFRDAFRFLTAEKRYSRLYLQTRWRLLVRDKSPDAGYPVWLQEDFESRLSLRERWESQMAARSFPEAVRPEAHGAMSDSMWPCVFESYDAGITRVPIEVNHPFFDLRLVNFLLSLPRLPWCSDKELLRLAGRGSLPEEVRLRRKSPLRSDPLIGLLQQPKASWIDQFEPVPELRKYVDRDRIPRVFNQKDSWAAWVHLRPLSLNFWLRRQRELG